MEASSVHVLVFVVFHVQEFPTCLTEANPVQFEAGVKIHLDLQQTVLFSGVLSH